MKKRWTALLLALAMLSALAVGALADEQKKDETAAEETAQTAPDAAGTLRFENLSARMKTGYYTVMSLEENIAAIECIDYDKMYEDLRDGLNLIADYQWGMIQAGQSGSYAYETLEQQDLRRYQGRQAPKRLRGHCPPAAKYAGFSYGDGGIPLCESSVTGGPVRGPDPSDRGA